MKKVLNAVKGLIQTWTVEVTSVTCNRITRGKHGATIFFTVYTSKGPIKLQRRVLDKLEGMTCSTMTTLLDQCLAA